jgi:hypothetical protein
LPILNVRHAGFHVATDLGSEVRWFVALGFAEIGRTEEKWGGRELEIVKLEAPDGFIVELVGGEWPPHLCIEVKAWPRSPVVLQDRGRQPPDEEFDIRFTRSPSGNWVELVKRRKG